MLRKKKYQKRFTQLVKNEDLVKWLRRQGAPDYATTFILEKGMGERLYLTILDSETVEIKIYGASHYFDGKIKGMERDLKKRSRDA